MGLQRVGHDWSTFTSLHISLIHSTCVFEDYQLLQDAVCAPTLVCVCVCVCVCVYGVIENLLTTLGSRILLFPGVLKDGANSIVKEGSCTVKVNTFNICQKGRLWERTEPILSQHFQKGIGISKWRKSTCTLVEKSFSWQVTCGFL